MFLVCLSFLRRVTIFHPSQRKLTITVWSIQGIMLQLVVWKFNWSRLLKTVTQPCYAAPNCFSLQLICGLKRSQRQWIFYFIDRNLAMCEHDLTSRGRGPVFRSSHMHVIRSTARYTLDNSGQREWSLLRINRPFWFWQMRAVSWTFEHEYSWTTQTEHMFHLAKTLSDTICDSLSQCSIK